MSIRSYAFLLYRAVASLHRVGFRYLSGDQICGYVSKPGFTAPGLDGIPRPGSGLGGEFLFPLKYCRRVFAPPANPLLTSMLKSVKYPLERPAVR